MATGYIYNGFGPYETRDGEQGITLKHAGIEFWLPFERVTAIPDFAIREVDHDKSTPPAGETGAVVYKLELATGTRVVSELVRKANDGTIPYMEMGVIPIEGKSTGQEITAWAGWEANGDRWAKSYRQVAEKEPTRAEIATAKAKAQQYKEMIVREFFQSKRERMTGGKGRLNPDPMVRGFMEELGLQDTEDILAHSKSSGMNPELLKTILEEVVKSTSVSTAETIAAVLKKTSPTAANGRRSLGLAENAAKYDAEKAKEKV